MIPAEVANPAPPAAAGHRRLLRWLGGAALLAAVALATVVEVAIHRAIPILKGRIVETLSVRFNSKVELDSLDVSLVKGLAVSGGGLRIFAPDDVVAAGATNPIIDVKEFSFHAPLRDLFLKPVHIGSVNVDGLEIHIPPRQARVAGQPTRRRPGKIVIDVDHFLCEHSDLIIDNGNPAKEPKHFALDRIELWEIGADAPWRYDATLVNAIPRGDIHATGNFGPWVTEGPGDSLLTGHYTFDHADLNPIKGIGGTLSSVGDFSGQLDRIEVAGTTQTPDFSLDSANQPMPLATSFRAIVDGTTGDTYLTQVNAKLRQTPINCTGSVVNIRGKGHVVDLDVQIQGGRLQDLLAPAVKTRPGFILTASLIATRAKLPHQTRPWSRYRKKLSVKQAPSRSIRSTSPTRRCRIRSTA